MSNILLSLTPEELGVFRKTLTVARELSSVCELKVVRCNVILNNGTGTFMFHTQRGMYYIEISTAGVVNTGGIAIYRISSPDLIEKVKMGDKVLTEVTTTLIHKQKKKADTLVFEYFEPKNWSFKNNNEKYVFQAIQKIGQIENTFTTCTLIPQKIAESVYVSPTETPNVTIIQDAVPDRTGLFYARNRLLDEVTRVGFTYFDHAPFAKAMILQGQKGSCKLTQVIAPHIT